MIHVVATITIKPGQRENFLREFKRMVPQTLAESGCLLYQGLIDCEPGVHQRQVPQRDDVVTIVEQWSDLGALRTHLAAQHMADYRERVKDFVISGSLQILKPA